MIKFYKFKKIESDINYQMKENIENNYFDLTIIKEKMQINFGQQIKKLKEIITLFKINEDFDKFENFKFENMNVIKILNDNEGNILCLKTLEDGRLAAGDYKSNLIIYNKETFKPDIIIKNNLENLYNFIQKKNKNIACLFKKNFTFKIIKIKNNFEYENIQIINNAHNKNILKIIELKNENLITFSRDCSFKIWKLNKNKYEKINEFKDTNDLSDGIEIKYNEILYSLNTEPQSIVFYDLNLNTKIKTLNNLNLIINILYHITKLNDKEVVVAGDKIVYLIDIENYLILCKFNSNDYSKCILKLSNNLFLIGDTNGTITQYRIKNKQIIKESYKNKSHDDRLYSMTILNNMIISGNGKKNEIKIWK